jgi:hypothetical protein
MGGIRGAELMQTSRPATIRNVLTSLVAPCQIPALFTTTDRDPVRIRANFMQDSAKVDLSDRSSGPSTDFAIC